MHRVAGQQAVKVPGVEPSTVDELRDRYGLLRNRILKATSTPVTIVAVTKGHGIDMVAMALQTGLSDLGENYASELTTKAAAVGEQGNVRWHMIGSIQRNRIAALARSVHLWHGVRREVEAVAIARHSPRAGVLVQVNLDGRTDRGGCAPGAVPAMVAHCRMVDLDVRGLMAVGTDGDVDGTRAGFRTVSALAADLGLTELSMGMSDDLEIALEAGATIVRIGTALFGPRDVRPGK